MSAVYRGFRIEVGIEGDGHRVAWTVFCEPSMWPTGVLMDGAVYLADAGDDRGVAHAEATRRAHDLIDGFLDRGVDPRRGDKRRS